MDLVGNYTKTHLPDLFETEINEILPSVKQILSFNNFPAEVDLFSRERVRQMIVDLFIMVLLSFKDCYEQMLQSVPGPSAVDNHNRQSTAPALRPMRLAVASDTSSVSSAGDTPEPLKKGRGSAGGALSQEISPRKLLISISNMEYVISHLLTAIVRRLGESGVKFGDLIHKVLEKLEPVYPHHTLLTSSEVQTEVRPLSTKPHTALRRLEAGYHHLPS